MIHSFNKYLRVHILQTDSNTEADDCQVLKPLRYSSVRTPGQINRQQQHNAICLLYLLPSSGPICCLPATLPKSLMHNAFA